MAKEPSAASDDESQGNLGAANPIALPDTYDARPPQIPDDLTDLVPSISDRELPKRFASLYPRPVKRSRPAGTILLVLAILIGIGLWIIGYFLRNDSPTIIDYRNGTTLLTERNGFYNRVAIQISGKTEQQYISPESVESKNPSLDPTGSAVAYLELRNGVRLMIMPINNTSFLTSPVSIASVQVQTYTINSVLQICPWTSIAWSSDGGQIAFFACGQNPTRSAIVISNLGPSPTLTMVVRSESQSAQERQLTWLDKTHIIATSPLPDTLQRNVLMTFDIP